MLRTQQQKMFSIEIEKKPRKTWNDFADEIAFGDLKQMLNHRVLTAFKRAPQDKNRYFAMFIRNVFEIARFKKFIYGSENYLSTSDVQSYKIIVLNGTFLMQLRF